MNIDMYWMKFQEGIQFLLAIGSIIGILGLIVANSLKITDMTLYLRI